MTQSRGVQERALAKALKTAPTRPEDAATVALARRYAQQLDTIRGEDEESAALVKLGKNYLDALAALGMTPAARKVRTTSGGGAEVHELKNPLEAARDAARARRAAVGDTSAT